MTKLTQEIQQKRIAKIMGKYNVKKNSNYVNKNLKNPYKKN